MKQDLVKELEKKQLFNISGLLEKDGFHRLLELKCSLCKSHLGFMANFISDRIHPEFLCDNCKEKILGN